MQYGVRLMQYDVRLMQYDVRLIQYGVRLMQYDVRLMQYAVRLMQYGVRSVCNHVLICMQSYHVTHNDIKGHRHSRQWTLQYATFLSLNGAIK